MVTRIHTNKRSEGVEISHFWDFLAKTAILTTSGDRKCLDIEIYNRNVGFLVKMRGLTISDGAKLLRYDALVVFVATAPPISPENQP